MDQHTGNTRDVLKREQDLFAAALERPAGERAAFLAGACLADPALRARLDSLLAAHEQPAAELAEAEESTVQADQGLVDIDEAVGQTLGRYKLLERIGEGGCGVVYVAEQTEPVRRRVALKVIKLGMDTKQVVARFEAERQALAMMDHPNIARVLDAGTTGPACGAGSQVSDCKSQISGGRPYFVMELVRGIKITDYCDQASCTTKERLDLFVKVCQAIQHAHQKGIIHRDIKPSNILVTLHDGVPVPKVIDFGIAKATEGKLTDATVYTQLHQFIGTPAYMSPEQAEMSGLDIDTRSDIYSLGVLLYELLTGKTPFDAKELMAAGIDAMRRTIREREPQRPSTRLATLGADQLTTAARRRSADTARLLRQLQGDLDWIVMKCLEKDRQRRYETANGLAADLKRHLNNEPVLARPPSTAYRFQKAFRRNKLAFTAAAAVAAALVVGISASVWQAVRANRALDELRATAPAFAEQARSLAAKEHYADAIAKLDYAVQLRPDVADYLVAKGDLLQCQLQLAPAAAMYREALRVQPGLARAEASLRLCDDLLALTPNADGTLTREALARLHLAMQQQQRPAAELLPVARLLGEEKKLLLASWLARLKDLPVSPENPLSNRLSVRDDGRLALNLRGARVTDLSPLAGAPLATLDVSKSEELTDISALRGLELIELNLSGTGVADLTPLRDMHTLAKLTVSHSKVSDLGPLSPLRLKSLGLAGCRVSDLHPIRKMLLEDIDLRETRVADLSPLVGMPVRSIDLSMAPVLDFSPLAELPLERCILQRNRITDLGVLRGKPLRELVLWASVEARNFAVLNEIKTLELLLLPAEYRDLPAEDYAAIAALRQHPALRQLGSEIMNQMGIEATGSTDLFWQDWDREQTFVPALRKSGVRFTLTKLPSRAYQLRIENQPLRDLSILRDAPVSGLILWNCPVSDLTPLRGLKLETLFLASDAVADLSPLRGMPLKVLRLQGSLITDLSALQELPLREVYIHGCLNATDLTPLAAVPTLERLTIPVDAGNIEALRRLPKLQMLSFAIVPETLLPTTTAAGFWRDYPWFKRLRDSGIVPTALTSLDDGTWQLNLDRSAIRDLSMLSNAPVSRLSISHTAVSDLTPLRGMALKQLWLFGTKVTDLSPLQGMPIEVLNLGGTRVSDLAPLRGMPLVELSVLTCPEVIDWSPLATATTLRFVTLSAQSKNFEALRSVTGLQRIGYGQDPANGYRPDKTAEEFWKEYDAAKKAAGKQP